MKKRQFLSGAALLAAAATPVHAATRSRGAVCAGSPVVLTVSGAIGRHNRGALDPVRDQLLARQMVKFDAAWAFDFATLDALPAMAIEPTLEYDGRPHRLSGPLLTDVLAHTGTPSVGHGTIMLRAIDGYAASVSFADARAWHMILATHLDGAPLALGGLGPLWAVYDADRLPEFASKPLKARFVACPWAVYHVQVSTAT